MTSTTSRHGVSATTRLAVSPQATVKPLGEGEGGVLLKLDSGELYTVNDTTLAFLQEMDGASTVADISARLSEVFDVESSVLTADLIGVADELIDESLLTMA